MVSYDSNMYSVECAYVGLAVVIQAYAWEIIVLHEENIIAHHARCFERNQKIYNPWHYIPALERKPGALRNGAPFEELMNILPSVFSKLRLQLQSHKNSDKQFIEILLLANKHGVSEVTNACEQAVSSGGCSAKMVEQYLQVSSPSAKQETEFIQLKTPPDADCTIYSDLYLKKEQTQ